MGESGEECRALLRVTVPAGTLGVCHAFLAQVEAWRGPVVVELARLSVDKEFASARRSGELVSLVDALARVRRHEQFALDRLGRQLASADAGP